MVDLPVKIQTLNITSSSQNNPNNQEPAITGTEARVYDTLINETPNLMYAFSLDYRFTFANRALLRMWGKPAEEAIGKGLRENGYEEWHAVMHEREIDTVVATKQSIRGTVSFPHAEFGKRVYDYIFVPVFNAAGNVESIAGSTRDITELKGYEEELRESEMRLRSVIAQTPAPTLVVRGDEHVLEQANKPMLELMGRTEEVIGMPFLDILPELRGQPVWEEVEKVYRTGVPFDQAEVPVPHNRTGLIQNYYYNLAYHPLQEHNKIVGVIQTAMDVTDLVAARKQAQASEQNLRNLVMQSPVGISVLDAATLKAEIVNMKFVEIAGKPYEYIIDRPYWETFAEAAAYYAKPLQDVIDKGKAFYADEVALMLIRNGKEETVHVTFVYEPMKEADGAVTKVVVWVMDNSTQVNARQRIEESEKLYRALSGSLEQQVLSRTEELRRSNADLLQFAHVASHDLKEPVRKIKVFTDRLRAKHADTEDEEETRYWEKIHTASERMFTMIEGVLSYSTTNSETQKTQQVNLNGVIKSISEDLEVKIEESGTRISSGKLPVVEGAPVLLYQLFYNLVNNSIKFAAAGVPPEITITSDSIISDDKRFHRIVFADNGIGFEQIYADKIFDTFTRLNSKDKYEGTGLGLALCKKIVERHGGTITASGNLGEGSVFTILLPVTQHENRKTA